MKNCPVVRLKFDPDYMYVVDIDGTICDSSSEYQRWRQQCETVSCHLLQDKESHFCGLIGRDRCIYEGHMTRAGIFSSQAVRLLPPFPKARQALKAARKAYYVSGRPESVRTSTLDWMESARFPEFRLLLRTDGDDRNISEIKGEMVSVLRYIYGKDNEHWVWIDDDERIRPIAERMGIEFWKAPGCFFRL